MKVLWLCNVGYKDLYRVIGIEGVPYGGWIEGALSGIKSYKNIELLICFPAHISKDYIAGEYDGISYFVFKASSKSPDRYENKYEQYFQIALDKFKPDIVHIWGTEYPHALAMVNIFNNPNNTIISIQGLCSIYMKHYYAFLPRSIERYVTFRDIVKKDTLQQQVMKFCSRGVFEKEALNKVRHVIGRTDWDLACARQINDKLCYHYCGEILRESFYQNVWNIDLCERFSVFSSQADYPIKGFHILLEAASIIHKYYPELKIYTTSRDPRKLRIYQITTYEKYIKDLIDKYDLNNSVVFLGRLNEKEMCDRYLRSNVFVSASSIENSPNSVGESMVLGVPTISSAVGGVNNLIQHNYNGIIYPADEPYMLAHYIMEIFKNDEYANTLSKAARENAIFYDKERNTDDLVNIYKEVIVE